MPPAPALPRAGRPALRIAAGAAMAACVVWALAWTARLQLIEPAAIAHRCAADADGPWCGTRHLLTLAFRHQEIGWVAAVLGSLAFLLSLPADLPPAATRRLGAAAAVGGLLAGTAGLVFYAWDPAAVGALLSAVALARAVRHENAGPLATRPS